MPMTTTRHFHQWKPLILIFVSILFFCCKQETAVQISGTDITTSEAKLLLNSGKVKFLDVRTPAEIANGKIIEATCIDFRSNDFFEKIMSLDEEQSYVVYCKSGGRSSEAVALMQKNGFKDVKNMLGGYSDWASKK